MNTNLTHDSSFQRSYDTLKGQTFRIGAKSKLANQHTGKDPNLKRA